MEASSLRYTLCFLVRGQDVLMLHRKNPPNRGLWNGIGGRIEAGETPVESALREIAEESGLQPQELRFAGLLTWDGFEVEAGGLYLFTAESPTGEPVANDEGDLAWKPVAWVLQSPEVVSNIHIFGPAVLRGEPPRDYHFTYRDGKIQGYQFAPLPDDFMPGLGRGGRADQEV